ncbi:growth hormone-regulated tbc protein 1-like protein [Chrysochromulina tobinii]|uniref:Growth hormone-regulated tbc protein 1-like protein n=1 Tax=Chrysochromulina tobinii TaxID=1460289 RepID=A0A0M0J6K7_9EUKA|nr:growth hormone-regulated tbc protein 1-like protein [Chrysochromulina tobinii]|eukprot:KOO22249.1 growth hormone-regulated tbc protein 1-like protein [Chrysochromulina sp. CCMP291]
MSLNVTGEDDRTELTAEQESDLAPIEKRWVQLAKTAGRGESESTLRSLLRTGVPPALRSRVWMAFSGAAAEVQPGMYEQLLAGKNSTRRTTNETQIELDIPRSGILDEATQNRLRRVLRAFAAFRPSCGYVQGQNFIAAGLLRVMHEEDAFWLLAIIVEAYLPDHFTQHMIGSLVDSQVLAELLAKRMPDVAAKLAALEVPVQLLVMRWFLSLWANVLPVPTLLRVYDLLFVLGPHVMPLVGLACFHVMRPTILAAKHADELSASHALQPLREAPPDQIVSAILSAIVTQGATQTVESPALLETTKSVCSETVKRARLGAHEGSDQKGSDPTTAPTDWGVAVRARLEEKRRAKEAALAAESEVRRTMQPQGLLYKEVNTEALERAIASARARDVNAALLNEAQAALDHKLAARLVQRALSHAMEDVTKEQKAQARAAKQFADEAAAEERRVREAMQPRLFGRGIDLMALERALERGRSQEDHKKAADEAASPAS